MSPRTSPRCGPPGTTWRPVPPPAAAGHRPVRPAAPWYDEWLRHPDRDAFWQATAPEEHYGQTAVPSLNIGGWYDIFNDGTLRNFAGMRTGGATAEARSGQRLIVGPWSHSADLGIFPERHYGSMAGLGWLDPTTLHRRWFDHWLKGIDPGVDREAPVKVFVMGADGGARNRTGRPTMRSSGRGTCAATAAPTARGDGRLTTKHRARARRPFLYDPRHPVRRWAGDPQPERDPGLELRAVGSAPHRGPRGRARLHLGAAGAAAHGDRARGGGAPTSERPRWTRTSRPSSWTSTRPAGRRSSPTASCGCATGTRLGARCRSSPGRVEEVPFASAARRICSGPAIGSARRLVEQLPALRREHEHGRCHRRRGPGRPGARAQPRLPRSARPSRADPARRRSRLNPSSISRPPPFQPAGAAPDRAGRQGG